jgi:two-component system chemotaxis sensor kinase CheA
LFNIRNTKDDEWSFIVIVGSQEKKIGVMVDELIGEEDVVIKPLRDQFTTSPGIAGASILGDGSVSLIIDVSQLLELGVRQELSAQQNREEAAMFASRSN